jgi:osmotically-inducible protein OsmY
MRSVPASRLARILFRAAPALAALPLMACIETAVIGGTAAVGAATALQDRGVKGAASDLAIRGEINDMWLKDRHGQAFMRDLNLQVQEGRVLVSGEVATADMRADAIQLAWKASGVREVLNEVEVGVNSLNYSVESYNGVVFLLGVAQDQTELNRVLQLARNIGAVKKVVNHVLLKDDPRRFRAAPG